MNPFALWTAHDVAGAVLILGSLSVLGAYQYMLVRDKNGPVIFGQPPREWLRLVHEHPRPWYWATVSFIGAILVTTLGLALLAGLLHDGGDPGFSEIGLVAFAFGTALWVIHLAARLTVDPWAGKELATTGTIPEAYAPLSRWNGALFTIFSILAFGGMLAFGAAILATHLLPLWLGWATIIYSAGGLILHAATRDSLPVMHHLMPLIIGIALLLSL